MAIVPQALILMTGMPGSGKSTAAQGLGRELGLPVIDKDVILSALLEAGIPEPQAHSAAYELMFELGEGLLRQRLSIVLDSPAGLRETVSAAERIYCKTSAQLITILCLADQNIRNERVATRRSLPSQPVGISKTPGNARERFLHLPAGTIELDTMQPLEDVVQDAVAAVRAVVASPLSPESGTMNS